MGSFEEPLKPRGARRCLMLKAGNQPSAIVLQRDLHKYTNMQTTNRVIQFKARSPKPATKPWVGPIQAERERCLAVCLDLAAQGHWGSVARTLLCETAMSAEAIIDSMQRIRAQVRAEIDADIAAGLFNTSSTTT
jgi:hypothetical protein